MMKGFTMKKSKSGKPKPKPKTQYTLVDDLGNKESFVTWEDYSQALEAKGWECSQTVTMAWLIRPPYKVTTFEA
jgi:hypothetical protein